MEKSAILNADLLDIVFEGRNKEYGAYELRRTYNRRLRTSVAVMLSVALTLCIGQLIAGRLPDDETKVAMVPTDLELENIEQPENEPPPVPPPPPPPPVERIQTIQYTTPVIVEEDIPEEEKLPELADVEDAKIDVATMEGAKDAGVVAPPEVDNGRDIVVAPKPKEVDPNTPIWVQNESEYPGGTAAWQRYLTRNLRIPQVVIDNRINGTVVVQFVVDREGNVSNVVALSGPEELRAEAVRVIQKSGKWKPALQNGIHVASYKKQPIVVRIEEE